MTEHGITGEDGGGYFCLICGLSINEPECLGKCPNIENSLWMIWQVVSEASQGRVGPWNTETMKRLNEDIERYLKLRSGKWRLDSYHRTGPHWLAI